MNRDEIQLAAEHMLASKTNLEAGLLAIQAGHTIYRQLIGKLVDDIVAELNEISPSIQVDVASMKNDPLKPYSKLTARGRSWAAGVCLAIEPQGSHGRNVVMGVNAAGAGASVGHIDFHSLLSSFGAGKQSKAWPWYRYELHANWTAPETLLGIYDGMVAKDIVESFAAMFMAVDPTLSVSSV